MRGFCAASAAPYTVTSFASLRFKICLLRDSALPIGTDNCSCMFGNSYIPVGHVGEEREQGAEASATGDAFPPKKAHTAPLLTHPL